VTPDAVLVDSNVLLDVLTDDPRWCSRSEQALARCADDGALAITPITYAEVSIRFPTIEGLEEALAQGRALTESECPRWRTTFAGSAARKARDRLI
jgi:hypothetical protein